ncbi:GNAT family N-acetyltransferase [Collimonas humicola]|uniref:GNAT family N-acetyltransferase n=1 Tax=Collimonas humicola TaxID=2825886 RepID=UPI001B8CB20B|nr:GNAT family N-acetyltransferase [Collimonas humicola]
MHSLRLSDKADLSVYYDADKLQFDAGWAERTGVSKAVFMAAFADHPSRGFEKDGVQFGGVIFDGKEVHVAVLPEFYGRWAILMKPALAWLFSLQEVINVRVDVGNARFHRFAQRCKWPAAMDGSEHVIYTVSNHAELFFNRRAARRAPGQST